MTKYGFIKIGSSISKTSKSRTGMINSECLILIDMISKHNEVEVLSFDNTNDISLNNCDNITYHEIDDIDINSLGLDGLIIHGGKVNFFGGNDGCRIVENYRCIKEFTGPITYILTDTTVPLEDIRAALKNKSGDQYRNKDKVDITEVEMSCITQSTKIEMLNMLISKTPNNIIPARYIHFPFEQFPLLNSGISVSDDYDDELIYFGVGNRPPRLDKIMKFYFDLPDDIKVSMYGRDWDKIKFKKHQTFERKPVSCGVIKYENVKYTLNRSLCTVAIGDPDYEMTGLLPMRIAEAVNASMICFIDIDIDSTKSVFDNDDVLVDFNYISSKDELIGKIRQLKNDNVFRKDIIKRQFDCLRIDKDEFISSFNETIKEALK